MTQINLSQFDKAVIASMESGSLIKSQSISVIYSLNITDGKYDFISSGIYALTGYTASEINEIGFDIIVKKIIEKNISGSEVIERKTITSEYFAKYLIETKSGEFKWVEDNSFVIQIENGSTAVKSMGILRDVSHIHKALDSLYKESSLQKRYLDLAEMILLVLNSGQKIASINKHGCKILGYSEEELIGKNWIDLFIPSEQREEVKNIFNLFLRNKNYKDYEYYENPIITKNGEKRIIGWHNTFINNEDTGEIFFVSSGIDITDKKNEEKIQHVISEILQAANIEGDLNEFFVFIHSSLRKLMPVKNFYISLQNKEDNSVSFPYFVDQLDPVAPVKKNGRGLTDYVLRKGTAVLVNRKEIRQLVEKGEIELLGTLSAVWLGIPLKIQDNTIGVLVVQDYSSELTYGYKEKEILEVISYAISRAIERKKVDQERGKLIDELKQLNTSKDKLFSLISHDLRSPFNSLLGFSEILTTEYDLLTDVEIKEYLNVIYESSKNLYSMTNNLLQFSRFQMGRTEFKPEKLYIKKIILENVSLLKGNIVKKQLNLSVNIDAEAEIFADEEMINSIVQNLISNAIKFTHRNGEIKIFTRFKKNDTKRIEIEIEDTGIGIGEADLNKIFHDTMHSTPGTEREYGSGLGLMLVKDFIETNGGEISVTSELNKGTSFTISFPVYE